MTPVFDTNILVDYLRGSDNAAEELGRYQRRAVSIITWMEILVGARNDEQTLRAFLGQFEVAEITQPIAELGVTLRRELRLRLPDAIILATAKSRETLLITRNTRDFDAQDPNIRVPYSQA